MKAATVILASLMGHALAAPANVGAESSAAASTSDYVSCLEWAFERYDGCFGTGSNVESTEKLHERCNQGRDVKIKDCLDVAIWDRAFMDRNATRKKKAECDIPGKRAFDRCMEGRVMEDMSNNRQACEKQRNSEFLACIKGEQPLPYQEEPTQDNPSEPETTGQQPESNDPECESKDKQSESGVESNDQKIANNLGAEADSVGHALAAPANVGAESSAAASTSDYHNCLERMFNVTERCFGEPSSYRESKDELYERCTGIRYSGMERCRESAINDGVSIDRGDDRRRRDACEFLGNKAFSKCMKPPVREDMGNNTRQACEKMRHSAFLACMKTELPQLDQEEPTQDNPSEPETTGQQPKSNDKQSESGVESNDQKIANKLGAEADSVGHALAAPANVSAKSSAANSTSDYHNCLERDFGRYDRCFGTDWHTKPTEKLLKQCNQGRDASMEDCLNVAIKNGAFIDGNTAHKKKAECDIPGKRAWEQCLKTPVREEDTLDNRQACEKMRNSAFLACMKKGEQPQPDQECEPDDKQSESEKEEQQSESAAEPNDQECEPDDKQSESEKEEQQSESAAEPNDQECEPDDKQSESEKEEQQSKSNDKQSESGAEPNEECEPDDKLGAEADSEKEEQQSESNDKQPDTSDQSCP